MDLIEIKNNNKILNIIRNFIENKINNDNIDSIIDNLNEKDLTFYIKTYKYNSSIDYYTAKRIINIQEFIFKIVEKVLKRKLSKNEKNNLIIECNISNGCTVESLKLLKLLKSLEEVLVMIPEEKKIKVIYIIIIACCYCSNTSQLLIEKCFNLFEEPKEQEYIINLIENTDKTNLSLLEEYDKISINGQEFNSNDIKEIRLKKYPKKPVNKETKTIKGNFKIIQINIKQLFIIVEDINNKMKKIHYHNDLLSDLQKYKERFKEAIDEEGKEFYIEATYTSTKENKITLNKIEEIKE
jgi:hypothetical protein